MEPKHRVYIARVIGPTRFWIVFDENNWLKSDAQESGVKTLDRFLSLFGLKRDQVEVVKRLTASASEISYAVALLHCHSRRS